MEAPTNVTKIVTPFVPTLFHLSSVKVALPLLKDFEKETWISIFNEITDPRLAELEARFGNAERSNAKEQLFLIPKHLRFGILEVIFGLHSAWKDWIEDHRFYTYTPDVHSGLIYWKTDGTIDLFKTAEQLLLFEKTDIEIRFDLACSYFLQKSIETLWEEMKASGKADRRLATYKPVSRFWVRRMRREHQIPLMEDVPKYLDLGEQIHRDPIPRFRAFYPLLQPDDRDNFFFSLLFSKPTDFLICMYGVTKEEELEILKMATPKVLFPHLNWPLQNFFLEMAGRLWNFIDCDLFKSILDDIFRKTFHEKDFDYRKLLKDFWEKSPTYLKEQARECPVFTRRINFYFDFIRIQNTKDFSAWKDYEKRPQSDYMLSLGIPPDICSSIETFCLFQAHEPELFYGPREVLFKVLKL